MSLSCHFAGLGFCPEHLLHNLTLIKKLKGLPFKAIPPSRLIKNNWQQKLRRPGPVYICSAISNNKFGWSASQLVGKAEVEVVGQETIQRDLLALTVLPPQLWLPPLERSPLSLSPCHASAAPLTMTLL